MMWNKEIVTQFIIILFFTVLNIKLFAQIEDYPDTLSIDSSKQELKMIVEKGDSTLLVPVDSIASFSNLKNKEWHPKRSWWMSAILPGLGQAHNHKYWKIPIIYTIFAGAYYMIDDNNFKYKIYKDAYAAFKTEGPPVWSPRITETQLKDLMDFYRRNRDFSIIIGAVFYLMNIVDASVDANLMDFDISEDLSLRISPEMQNVKINTKKAFGLKFVISLNK